MNAQWIPTYPRQAWRARSEARSALLNLVDNSRMTARVVGVSQDYVVEDDQDPALKVFKIRRSKYLGNETIPQSDHK
jgi:hypothetical protein